MYLSQIPYVPKPRTPASKKRQLEPHMLRTDWKIGLGIERDNFKFNTNSNLYKITVTNEDNTYDLLVRFTNELNSVNLYTEVDLIDAITSPTDADLIKIDIDNKKQSILYLPNEIQSKLESLDNVDVKKE